MHLIRPLIFSSLVLCTGTHFTSPASAQQVAVPGVYSTGVDSSGNPMGVGVLDPHYTLTGAGTNAQIIQRHSAWVNPPTGSAWIGVAGGTSTAPAGNFIYTMTFDLTGYQANTAVLTGDIAADNQVTISLNGVVVSPLCCWFGALTPQTISSGFVAGVNTLEIDVYNIPTTVANPSGLVFGNVVVMATPDVTPTLAVSNLVAGAQASLDVTGATPSSSVGFAYSIAGSGPTILSGICAGLSVSLSAPIKVLGQVTADAAGTASFVQTVPPTAAFIQVHMQAVDIATCTPTNLVTATVQ